MPELSRFPLTPGLHLWAPPEAGALIDEIWNRDRYFLHAGLAEGETVVDIGANVGVFTVLAASRGARVHAFEPNPEAFALLSRNVRENGFADRVRCRNLAVVDREGILDLSVPDSGKIYSMGSATTTTLARERLGALPEVSMRTFPVRCTTLPVLADGLPGRAVHFLKIDCEGAEWEILRSLVTARECRPRHIAMETHAGYRESEMVDLLRGLGYVVTGHVKRSGRFETGYLYASAGDLVPAPVAADGVAAILSVPACLGEGGELRAGSEESFSLSGGTAGLSRAWELDGKGVGDGERLSMGCPPAGLHALSLRIRDGELTDTAESRILVLEKDYFAGADRDLILASEGRTRVSLSGSAAFRIPAASLPGAWEIDGVTVAVHRPRQAAPVPLALALRFNGTARPMGRDYDEIRLDFPAPGVDLRFRLDCAGDEEIEIGWWPVSAEAASREAPPEPEPLAAGVAGGGSELPAAGRPGLARFAGTRPFRIAGALLPKEWTPKAIKIGIAAMPAGGVNLPLAGSLEHAGVSHGMDGWYREIALPGAPPEAGVDFVLSFPGEANLKLVWWAE